MDAFGEKWDTPWTGHQFMSGMTHKDIQPFMLKFMPTENQSTWSKAIQVWG